MREKRIRGGMALKTSQSDLCSVPVWMSQLWLPVNSQNIHSYPSCLLVNVSHEIFCTGASLEPMLFTDIR